MTSDSKVIFYLEPSAKEAGASIEAPREGDAGFDIRAAENSIIEPGEQKLISTGLKASIPLAWVGIIKDRSSMAIKGIRSHAGVIDASYRGEIKVLLSNAASESFHIEAGDRVAQMVVIPCLVDSIEVDSEDKLGETGRGAAGFGSTGK